MIDTVKISSPPVDEETAQEIEHHVDSMVRLGMSGSTGEVVYTLTNCSLLGSYDHRLSVRVRSLGDSVETPDYRSEYDDSQPITRNIRTPVYEITIEGSAHKAMLGHNLRGGSDDARAVCRWIVNHVASSIGIQLPNADAWILRRIDVAYCFDVGNQANVLEYISLLRHARFPRRKVRFIESQGLHVTGRTTSVKVYNKGLEFKRHDYPRLKSPKNGTLNSLLNRHVQIYGREEWLDGLARLSNRLVRVEVECKRALQYLDAERNDKGQLVPGDYPTVGTIDSEDLSYIYRKEIKRLMTELNADAGYQLVSVYDDVENRLRENCSRAVANNLLAFWMQLSALGESEVKRRLPKSSFYEKRKKLLDLGISWHDSDVIMLDANDPHAQARRANRPTWLPDDASCLRGEDPLVSALLEEHRDVA